MRFGSFGSRIGGYFDENMLIESGKLFVVEEIKFYCRLIFSFVIFNIVAYV
jgi:hypothetical protein